MTAEVLPVRGRASVAVRQRDTLLVEVSALRAERADDVRRMGRLVPYVRFVRASACDVAAERAAGVVQLEVERIARRGGYDAA